MKVKGLLLLLFAVNLLTLHAQEQQDKSLNAQNESITDWKDYFQNEKVKIEVAEQSCNDIANGISNNYKVFKITNKTNAAIKVSFLRQIWYDQDKYCVGCEGGSEFTMNISLSANETKAGSCSGPNDLRIFKDSPDGFKSTLSKFELKDITVR